MSTGGRRARRRGNRSIVLALALLLAFGPLLGATATGTIPLAPRPGSPAGGTPAAPHPSALRMAIGPTASAVWYTQEGATLSEVNSSATITTVPFLSEEIPLVTSPYPTGYELNGISSTGDWYQVLVADNWGGCNTGLEMVYELWDNAGGGYSPVCDPAPSLSSGDLVRLTLTLPSLTKVCLGVADLTTALSEVDCETQVDTGATSFELLSSTSNSNGYFSGPMTEVGNTAVSSCPDYTNMPVLNYEFPTPIDYTQYVPWSDEWEYGGSSTTCYAQGGSTVTIGPGDPTTDYQDTAAGTSYGPHVIAGQNYSAVAPGFGLRLQTDPAPLTSIGVSASPTTVRINQSVGVTATVLGGETPYTIWWYLNGHLDRTGGATWNWTPTTAGTYQLTAYAVDKLLDVVGPSSAATVHVNAPLSVGPITFSTGTGGADAGQPFVIAVTAFGGSPPYTYYWGGLPGACPAADADQLSCDVPAAGAYSVEVVIHDANASSQLSTATLEIASALTAHPSASATVLDVNQSVTFALTSVGGVGPYLYQWTGLPPGCAAADVPSIHCRVTMPGNPVIGTTISDANGYSVAESFPLVRVFSDPSVSLLANRNPIDAGVPFVLFATAVDGAGGFTYLWSGLPTACDPGNSTTAACTLPASSTYGIAISVTDAANATVTSPVLILYAYPPLAVTFQGPPSVVTGTNVTWSSFVSGGFPGPTYTWGGLPTECAPSTTGNDSCVVMAPGSYNVTLTVTDAGGGRVTRTVPLVVTTAPAGSFPALDGVPAWAYGALGVGLVAVVSAVLLARRRRR